MRAKRKVWESGWLLAVAALLPFVTLSAAIELFERHDSNGLSMLGLGVGLIGGALCILFSDIPRPSKLVIVMLYFPLMFVAQVFWAFNYVCGRFDRCM